MTGITQRELLLMEMREDIKGAKAPAACTSTDAAWRRPRPTHACAGSALDGQRQGPDRRLSGSSIRADW